MPEKLSLTYSQEVSNYQKPVVARIGEFIGGLIIRQDKSQLHQDPEWLSRDPDAHVPDYPTGSFDCVDRKSL